MSRLGRRNAFTLVELLVAVSIVLVLMVLLGGALAAARTSGKKQATQAAIMRLNDILTTQFRRYAARRVAVPEELPQGMTPSSYRAWRIRRDMITGDMPDRWTDVAYMADREDDFTSAPQRAYIATWQSLPPSKRIVPTDQGYPKEPMSDEQRKDAGKDVVCFTYAGAECLFMIVMQGGFADCLDCNSLSQLRKGDKDGDGMLEFWDAWGNPIDYILWPAGYEVGSSGTRFFTNGRALDAAFPPASATGAVRSHLGMRPLIYSAGPDGEYGLERNGEQANMTLGTGPEGRDCGNPANATVSGSGGPTAEDLGQRRDNITSFDAEAGR